MNKKFLSFNEVAELFGVDPDWIRENLDVFPHYTINGKLKFDKTEINSLKTLVECIQIITKNSTK